MEINETAAGPSAQIVAFLVEGGFVTNDSVERARRLQADNADRLEIILWKLGLVAEQHLACAFEQCTGLPPLSGDCELPASPVLRDELSAKFLRHYRVIPISHNDREIVLAMSDPLDAFALHAVGVATERAVKPVIATPSRIDAMYDRLYADGTPTAGQLLDARDANEELTRNDVEQLQDLASEAPVIRFVNTLIDRAIEIRASDIHVEPEVDRLRIRFRIDGVLHEINGPPHNLTPAIISRIKVMARMNIAERRLPQDERITLPTRGKEVDLRVSTMPTVHGESVVLRILDRDQVSLQLDALGFNELFLASFTPLLKRPNGIVLVTGPVGSGKTTTLYAALQELNDGSRKIITVEDPVEYQIPGTNQTQIKPQIGLTFATALRSMLRQDFDVLMIGEIRDAESANIGIQASLMGRIVLSTLHTNDAPGSLTRLLNMGVEDYLLTSTVSAVVAQRLIRTLCDRCRRPSLVAEDLHAAWPTEVSIPTRECIVYVPVGCGACGHTGYLGRTTIAELMVMTDRVRACVLKHADTADMFAAARAEGMRTMFECGMEKALAGITSLDEVLRVTRTPQ